MANEFSNVKLIARQMLPRLIENLVMPNLCYKDYSEDYANLGDTIQVRKPTKLTAVAFNPASGTTDQDIKEETVDVKLDTLATVDVGITAVEAATNLENLQQQVIEPAAVALAEKINQDGLKMYTQFPAIGTAGTTPDGLDDFAAARKYLNKQKAPMTGRVAVWDPEADAAFSQIGNLVKVNEAGASEALREGQIGRVMGLDNYMAQGVAQHTKSAAGTVLVDGAATKGANMIHVDGLSAAFAIGDHFTIAGDTTVYTVVKAGTLDTADQDVYILPALQKNAANDAAITVGANYTGNMVFHKNAIAFVTRPLHAPAGVEAYTTSYNGVTLRVVRGYDMTYKKEKISVDVLYGYKAVYPELGVTYMG